MRHFSTAAGDPLLAVEDAVGRVLAEVQPGSTEIVSLADSLGRVLREVVVAAVDVPPSDNSAMDGYAVRAGQTPGRLRVTGDVAAGHVAMGAVEEGAAIRIMTGAPIPAGADAVAPVEVTDGGSGEVVVHRAVAPGANVRRRGEDMRAGSIVLQSGLVMGPAEIGVAAAARSERLVVARKPVLAILATGDELSTVSEATPGGGIVDSNSWALAALATQTGAIPRRLPAVRDTRDATVAAIEQALDADFIVSTGGVSVGAYDFVKESIEALGARTHFWRVAMKPGKPVLFATVRDRLFFGLPGNPVSAMVSFTLFVAPAIRKALGRTDVIDPVVHIRTSAPLKGAGDRRSYLRVRVVTRGGELVAEPMRAQGSHVSTSMVQANGLAVVDDSVEAGQIVPVVLIGAITSS